MRVHPLTPLPIAWGLLALLASGCSAPPEHFRAEGALGPYSGAVTAGNLCFVSGKIGERGGTFSAEVHTAIDAVESELRRAGLGLEDVAFVAVYLTDIQDYDDFNAIYTQRFPQPYPARSCVSVKSLPGDARVELQAVAARSTK